MTPSAVDPCDIPAINELARSRTLPGDEAPAITIQQICVEVDALPALADSVTRLAGRNAGVLLITDQTPMRRGAGELRDQILDRLGHAGLRVSVRRLPPTAGHRLRAEAAMAEALAAELAGHAAVLSVGSGTITDLVKYTRHVHQRQSGRRLPWICFPTAASVTAYTSTIAVLNQAGVKRNFPGGLPDALICDLRTLADAPPAMTRAGFGDVIARSVAYGDWYLAHELGMDDRFTPLADELLGPAEQRLIASARSVAAGTLEGVQAVTEALLLAGMAMSLVNQTAPISGWEHVISHFLDIVAAGEGRTPALHGAQVGVATLIVAGAYERTWGRIDLGPLAGDLPAGFREAWRQRARGLFDRWDPSGRMSAEIWREYTRKLDRWEAVRRQREVFVARQRAGEFDAFMGRAVRPPSVIAEALTAAGAPRSFHELDPPVTPAIAATSLENSHLVRARFTLGDLLTLAGWLHADRAAELIR